MIPNLNNLDVKNSPSATHDPSAMPGVIPKGGASSTVYDNMRVRYGRFDLNEMVDISELEKIETRAIRGQGVYILSRKDFVFMDKIFMLVSYLEEDRSSVKASPDLDVKKIERKGGTTEPLSFRPDVTPPAPIVDSSVPSDPVGPVSLAPWDEAPMPTAITPEDALAQALKNDKS